MAEDIKNTEATEVPNGNFIPVSYTHLRAHETGRNLVCRLLLEKKKTTKGKEKQSYIIKRHKKTRKRM